ncbi:hypothetical protein BGX26_006546 [Mortierella sp. AD094]|nr:hypothetical protein BGX26_006546 [Mortierella sp. AD094]
MVLPHPKMCCQEIKIEGITLPFKFDRFSKGRNAMLTRGKASKDKLIDWRYLETDKDTKQLIINVGTKTIDCVLKPGTHNLQPGAARFLKQLVNSHEGVPKHLHGLLNLEGHVRWITRSDHFISVEQKNDPTKLAWYFNACCDTYERPVGAAKMKIGGPYKNNG